MKIKKTTRQASLLVSRCLLKYLMIKIRLNQNIPLQHPEIQHGGGNLHYIIFNRLCFHSVGNIKHYF